MGRRFEVTSSQFALGLVWKRVFPVADSLLTDASDLGDPEISIVPQNVGLNEGDWVTLDADKKVVLTPVTPPVIAFPIDVGGERFDARAQGNISVVWGHHTAITAAIAGGLTAGVNALLTSHDGVLQDAASGEPVHAIAESAVLPGTDQFPDGFVEYSTLQAGGFAP